MKPHAHNPQTDEIFGSRLDEQLNMRHPLVRLAGLLYLQHVNDASDEAVVNTWLENPYWQYFCGEQYLQIELPINSSSLTRWGKRIGEERVEILLAVTIEVARTAGLIRKNSTDTVIVDTTVIPTQSKPRAWLHRWGAACGDVRCRSQTCA